MVTRSVGVDRLRGIWIGVRDLSRTRQFYEQLGALFEGGPHGGILSASLGGTRLVFEEGSKRSHEEGVALLFDIPDADAFHSELRQAGLNVEGPPKDEPWGRQLNVRDPDGHLIAFIGPAR